MSTYVASRPGVDSEEAIAEVGLLLNQVDEVARRLPGLVRPIKLVTIREAAARVCVLSETLRLAVHLASDETGVVADVERLAAGISHLDLLLAKARHSHELAVSIRFCRSLAQRLQTHCQAWEQAYLQRTC